MDREKVNKNPDRLRKIPSLSGLLLLFFQLRHFCLDGFVDFIQQGKAAAIDSTLSGGYFFRTLPCFSKEQLIKFDNIIIKEQIQDPLLKSLEFALISFSIL